MNELLANYPAVLDVATVAEILGVTLATVRRLLKANVIPSVKVGRLTRVTKDKLIDYLEERSVQLMKEKTNISLELLLLNDLLRTKVIDKEIYDKAVAKINTTQNQAA